VLLSPLQAQAAVIRSMMRLPAPPFIPHASCAMHSTETPSKNHHDDSFF
jgi:hypothetical protein